MSLRRRSCDACFRGRRKCDRGYPVCKRGQKNERPCHYASKPAPVAENENASVIHIFSNASHDTMDHLDVIDYTTDAFQTVPEFAQDSTYDFGLQDSVNSPLYTLNVPSFLGELGEVKPVEGNTRSWEWVITQLKGAPLQFAQQVENIFIHRDLYADNFPQSIRAAFGICAGSVYMNDANKTLLFQSLETEASKLLQPDPGESLLEQLAKLQAMVFYQIIRLYHGGLEQRIIAEQQENLIGAMGLNLLHRSTAEIGGEQTNRKQWILAESIRRTIIVAFMLHCVYSASRHGDCSSFPTLALLPVSTKTDLWRSGSLGTLQLEGAETIRYKDFTEKWVSSPQGQLEPYEKIILVACKGLEKVESLTPFDITV
ncbi:hypothetical protein EJ08DRAFT_332568 [Tothia fuscella]|uniref:Zn(2)-C6 fungal-type domain-containing protein n=1 Tax=Tothia fuscella TaxID=1048955 RepID=A0A9P4NMN3_9PEZI|nr:hypothetical protein EJ08DRAFT_332568 [Tothia fuscella]